ncbi:MAG: hypothetical protein IKM20_10495 [Erysipelotrichales bacterium]|nr:hypothetical protein [Erysipelotrichales bacterium]
MNYYDELIDELQTLILEGKNQEALEKINVELRMPYIPKEYEEKLNILRKDIQTTISDANSSRVVIPSDEELENLLFSSSLDEEMMAIQSIRKLRLDNYYPLLEEYLKNPIYDEVQSLIIYLLIESGTMKEFVAIRNEMEMTFIPKYCELPEESDGYEFGMEFLENHIEKEPSILKMCTDLLHMKLLNYLPFSYEEDEVDILCQCIIYQVYLAMDEEQKWIDLCLKNAWKREEIEKIAN